MADLIVYYEKLQLKCYAMPTRTRRNFRAIIYYNFLRGSSKKDCFEEMSEVFSEDSPSVRTVERWYLHFRRGLLDIEDDLRLSVSEWSLYSSLKVELSKLFS